MSVSSVLEHYLEGRRNARVLNVPIADMRDEPIDDDGWMYYFRDSTLYRRKKLHDVELQPCTDSLATPLTDAGQTTDKQRWAKILDAEDSEEEVPVLSSHTILVLLIWWIVDYGVNIPLYQANAISPQKYATPIVWVVLTFAYIVYSSLKVHREGTLHRKYGGWLVNAWIGVRGTLDPARKICHLPTVMFIAWLSVRIAAFAAVGFDGPGISNCSATLSDSCEYKYVAVIMGQATVMLYLAQALVLITLRLNICPGAHGALVQQAKDLAEVYPPIEDVLIAAELKVQSEDDLRRAQPWMHRLLCLLCFSYAAYNIVVVLVVEGEQSTLGADAVLVTLLAGVAIGLSAYALGSVVYSLSATYEACVIRMQMLTLFLYDHSIDDIRLLRAWWKLRSFYLNIITPICYQAVQASAVVLGLACIFFLALLCFYAAYPPQVDYDERMKVVAFMYLVAITVATAPSAVIVLGKASNIAAEQNRHIELLSRKVMGVRSTRLGLKDGHSAINDAKHALRRSPTRQPDNAAVEPSELDMLVDDMVHHIEKFDPKPTFLGVTLNDTTLKILYGYVTTAVSFVLVLVLQQANIQDPFFN